MCRQMDVCADNHGKSVDSRDHVPPDARASPPAGGWMLFQGFHHAAIKLKNIYEIFCMVSSLSAPQPTAWYHILADHVVNNLEINF